MEEALRPLSLRGIEMQIKPADLFFTTSNSFISWSIRQRTWGRYSHVQIIVSAEVKERFFPEKGEKEERKEYIEKTIPEISVVSADAGGVYCRAIHEDEKNKYAIMTCPGITESERDEIVKFCLSQIGKPYDFIGLASFLVYKELQNDNSWFCSELAYVAYKQAGIRLVRRVQQDFVSPRDLYISPMLQLIEERM